MVGALRLPGEYRTKRLVLGICNAMRRAIETGKPYQTRSGAPPGPPTASLATQR
jgi:hypothetical protein